MKVKNSATFIRTLTGKSDNQSIGHWMRQSSVAPQYKQSQTLVSEGINRSSMSNEPMKQADFVRRMTNYQQNKSPRPSLVAFQDTINHREIQDQRRNSQSQKSKHPLFKNRLASFITGGDSGNQKGPPLARSKTSIVPKKFSISRSSFKLKTEETLGNNLEQSDFIESEQPNELKKQVTFKTQDPPLNRRSGISSVANLNGKNVKQNFKTFFSRNLSMPGPEKVSKRTRLRDLKAYTSCIILPDDPWKMRWDLFLLLTIVFTSLVTPYQIAFFQTESQGWLIVESVIDCVFFIDLVFSFYSAYYNKVQQVIDNKRKIACGYLKTWFFIDLISIIPIQHFITDSSNVNSLGQLAKIPRFYRILKTLKQASALYLRIMRMTKIMEKRSLFQKKINKLCKTSTACQKSIILASSFILMWHTLSCIFFLVAKLEGFPEQSWVIRYGFEGEDHPEQYLASLYFIITTITTVGYGDVTTLTTYQRIFCCFLMVLGVVSYSMAISQITSIMTANDRKEQELKQKLDILSSIRRTYPMSFDLYLRLRQSIHHRHLKDHKDTQHLMDELPNKLRLELSNVLYQYEVKDIEYFQKKSPHFIASVAPLLKPVKIQKDQYVYFKDDPIDGIYFIKSGDCGLITPKFEADLVFYSAEAGQYFGQTDFLLSSQTREASRQYTAKALTDLEALVLEKQDLYNVDMEFKKEIMELFNNPTNQLNQLQEACQQAELWLDSNNLRRKKKPKTQTNFNPPYYSSEEEKIEEESESSQCGSDDEQDQTQTERGETHRNLLTQKSFPILSITRRSKEASSPSLKRKRNSGVEEQGVKLHCREQIGSFFIQSIGGNGSKQGKQERSNSGFLNFSSERGAFKSMRNTITNAQTTANTLSQGYQEKGVEELKNSFKEITRDNSQHVTKQMIELKDEFKKVENMIKTLVERNTDERRKSLDFIPKSPRAQNNQDFMFDFCPLDSMDIPEARRVSSTKYLKESKKSWKKKSNKRTSAYMYEEPEIRPLRQQFRRGSSIDSNSRFNILEAAEKQQIVNPKASADRVIKAFKPRHK